MSDDGGPRATPAQVAKLRRHGIEASGMSRRRAGWWLAKVRGRLTVAQEKALGDAGEAVDCSPEKATALLTILKARGWKPRDYPLVGNRWIVMCRGGEWFAAIYDPDVGRVPIDRPFRTEKAARKFIQKCVEGWEWVGSCSA